MHPFQEADRIVALSGIAGQTANPTLADITFRRLPFPIRPHPSLQIGDRHGSADIQKSHDETLGWDMSVSIIADWSSQRSSPYPCG